VNFCVFDSACGRGGGFFVLAMRRAPQLSTWTTVWTVTLDAVAPGAS
jgi:hypothetical protein